MNYHLMIANHRTDKKLKEVTLTWEEFCNKLSTTYVTNETQKEYKNMKKHEQDNIKDIGGFVAGSLKDGRRLKENVISRNMLTLDIDYLEDVNILVDNLELLFNLKAVIYSTHKHTPDKPRLRLIIPLSRDITPDEYQAVSRQLAKEIDIEIFDDTTYQANRLMYFPSTSSDGQYFFKRFEGETLNPDDILNSYKDWKDTTTWPVSSRQEHIINGLKTKQIDPLEKDGLVGTFCRAYPINVAIDTFLPKVYTQSDIPNRYDYILADSSAGVVIYDDKFAYSHHATDPVCNKLLNSFDLVRIHLFGELDKKKLEKNKNVKMTDLPSYIEMINLCIKDKNVKKQLSKERNDRINEEFEKAVELNPLWELELELDKRGNVRDTLTNIVTIMRHDPDLQNIVYNQTTHMIDVKGNLPWRQLKPGWSDTDLANLKIYFDRFYSIWSPSKIKDGLLCAVSERPYHPIKEYLDHLPVWDGTERIDNLLIDYFNAEDNCYSKAVIRKILIAAVARVYEPGKKFDYILVLNGPQGIGKSTFFAKLGQKWFSDSLSMSDMRDKSGAEKLQGYWILELGELAGLRKTDVETVKSFITRTDDMYRPSYGVNVESHPRQCIIVGSTNNTSGFLRDITGNRRFWPIRVEKGRKNVWELTDVDQIWAEALHRYKDGEEILLLKEEEMVATDEQREAMESDEREGIIKDFLDTLLPENWKELDVYERRSFLNQKGDFMQTFLPGTIQRDKVCVYEIWCECLAKDKSNLTRRDSYAIIGILTRIGGWEVYEGNKQGQTRFPMYGNQKTYCRVNKL